MFVKICWAGKYYVEILQWCTHKPQIQRNPSGCASQWRMAFLFSYILQLPCACYWYKTISVSYKLPGAKLARIPLFGYIDRKDTILVNRNNDGSRPKIFKAMKQMLSMHMCIYPERTRNKITAPLQPFYSGAFKLAADTGKPIIPALIFNTRQVGIATRQILLPVAAAAAHSFYAAGVCTITGHSAKPETGTVCKNGCILCGHPQYSVWRVNGPTGPGWYCPVRISSTTFLTFLKYPGFSFVFQ